MTLGVIGEYVADFTKLVKGNARKTRLSKISTLTLIAGLAIELVGLVTTSHVFNLQVAKAKDESKQAGINASASFERAAVAEKEAGQANERASTNELAAKQLEIQLDETKTQLAKAQANLIELQNANLPMDIGNQPEFGGLGLSQLPRTPVKLRSLADDKAEKTADNFEIAFNFGGWILVDRAIIGEIGESGIIIGYNFNDGPSKKAAMLLMKLLTAKNIPSKTITSDLGLRVEGIPTNGIIVAVCNRPDPLNEKLMLVQAKKAELDEDSLEIRYGKMFALETKKFQPNSKELQDAQAEYNKLTLQYSDVEEEKNALDESEKQIKAEIDKKVFGTNVAFRVSNLLKFDPATRTFNEKTLK